MGPSDQEQARAMMQEHTEAALPYHKTVEAEALPFHRTR